MRTHVHRLLGRFVMEVDRGGRTWHWECRLRALDLEVFIHSRLPVVENLASAKVEVIQKVVIVISQYLGLLM